MKGIASLTDVIALEAKANRATLPASSYELIATRCRKAPKDPALTFFLQTADYKKARTWNYRELLRQIHRSANFFHSLGATKDTVIAFVLPNLPETHWVIWGGEATGIVFAVNPLLESAAIGELLAASEAEIVVTLAPFPGSDLWQKVQPQLASLPKLRHVVTVSLSEHARGTKRLAARGLQRAETLKQCGLRGIRGALPKGVKCHDLNRGMRRQTARKLISRRSFQPTDLSSYFCTGGTTGLPKIAMREHGNEVANAWSATQFQGDSVGPGKTIFCGLPLFHVNAVLVTGLGPFSQGAHVVLGPPQGYRSPGLVPRFWEIVEHFRINFFSGVPTLYAGLLQFPTEGFDLSSLEYGLCGAAPLPAEVIRRFEERTGLKILEGYGLTEGTCVSTVNPPLGTRKTGSIGIRIPGQEMKAVLIDESGAYERDARTDEVGVLVIRGPNVFRGYKNLKQNDGLWLCCDKGDPWLNTGDMGRQDTDGYFFLTGRKKELIIRGGHNIDPAVIEAPLHRHPAVELAAAIGRPDAHAGELPVAYVQLKKDCEATPEELMAFVQGEISERAALPKAIVLLDAMPLTGVGKIFKPDLKKREIAGVLAAELEQGGVSVEALRIEDSKEHGLLTVISLPTDQHDSAKAVLGRFSIPYSFENGASR